MKFSKILIAGIFAAGIAAGANAQYAPGQGVANTHANGVTATNVEFVQRGGGEEYGWRGYTMPIGFTVLPWAIPNFESTVAGLRLNFGWGRHKEVYGFDTGFFGAAGDFGGISANVWGNLTENDAAGIQIGGANIVSGTVRGLQIGFFNYTHRLVGVQIGVLNFNESCCTLPIINAGW